MIWSLDGDKLPTVGHPLQFVYGTPHSVFIKYGVGCVRECSYIMGWDMLGSVHILWDGVC